MRASLEQSKAQADSMDKVRSPPLRTLVCGRANCKTAIALGLMSGKEAMVVPARPVSQHTKSPLLVVLVVLDATPKQLVSRLWLHVLRVMWGQLPLGTHDFLDRR